MSRPKRTASGGFPSVSEVNYDSLSGSKMASTVQRVRGQPPPLIDFSADDTTPATDQNVVLTATITGDWTTGAFEFDRAVQLITDAVIEPGSLTATVRFVDVGLYTISLRVEGPGGTTIVHKAGYINSSLPE
jgi:hypothetical protein